MKAMTEFFVKGDVREIFEIPSSRYFKPQRKRWRILENLCRKRKKLQCYRTKLIKRELCRSWDQEIVQKQVQVDDSPERAQQLPSPGELRQGGGHLSAAQPLPSAQQPQGGHDIPMQPQRETVQGDMAPDMGPQQTDQEWEVPEVTVKVRSQKMSQGWECPEVTVQVQPRKSSPKWEAPPVTVQVQQQCQRPSLPHVTVQVQPQKWRQGTAGIKVTVQLQFVSNPEEVTCLQDQGEEASGNGEQQTPKQDQEEPIIRFEAERELAVVELVPQGMPCQKEDQGKVAKTHQYQNEEEKSKVVEKEAGDKADLNGLLTEEHLQDQSQEQEQLKADVPPQKEGQRTAEMRQERGDIQGGPKGMMEDQKEDTGQEVSKKHPREAPNYFVAIPIMDDQILDRIEDVQELIFSKEPDLLRALLPIQTMHLTIIVAHLGTEEEVKKAVLALKKSKTKVEDILQGKDFNMTFQGIGRFNNQVLYVKMLEKDQKMLSRIAEAVEECFIEMNLDISESKDFKPHLTFLKLSKVPWLRRRVFRKICLDLYKEYENSYFGTEVFSRIDLCAMHKKKQESGYYYCDCSINVNSSGIGESKEQEMQKDVGETTSEDLSKSVGKAEMGATAASCKPISTVVDDDKPSENIAEASLAIKEEEINEAKGQPEATDGTFLTAGEICSTSVLGLLPASSDV